MPFAQVNDVSLYYTDEGEGAARLFVHGWACDSHDWNWQLAHFGNTYRVIAADNRGHGRSQVPADGYTPRQFADDLAALIRQRGAGPVIAIGHSLGGVIANILAVEYPDLVRGVIALDPAYGVDAQAEAGIDATIAALATPEGALAVGAGFVRMSTEATPAFLKTWHRRRALGLPYHVFSQSFINIYSGPEQLGRRAASSTLLARRTTPFLTVYMGRRREVAQWEQEFCKLPVDQVTCLDVGHWPHQELPDEVNGLIETWIEGMPPSTGTMPPVT